MYSSHKTGFTLTEIVVVVAVLAVLAVILTLSVARYTRTQALTGGMRTVVSKLEDARSRTLSSQGGSQYGVHFESGSVTLFRGDTYASNDSSNEATSLDSRISLATALSGGGSNVVFERLTGETFEYGTVTASVISEPTLFKTVIIQQTGLVSHSE